MLARSMIFGLSAFALGAGLLLAPVTAQEAGTTPAPAEQPAAAPAPTEGAPAPAEPAAPQAGPGDPAVAAEEDGKFADADGDPTFQVGADGTVDWYTYSGFRRYHSECHVCHGPDGEGSSYAPRLVDSVQRQTYSDFMGVVASGRVNVHGGTQSVMPAFGTNLNVMCYVDDIYVYLRARAQADLPRGRPGKRADKPPAAAEAEKACLGT
jgi:methanol metabolism-related c-type cytochrome